MSLSVGLSGLIWKVGQLFLKPAPTPFFVVLKPLETLSRPRCRVLSWPLTLGRVFPKNEDVLLRNPSRVTKRSWVNVDPVLLSSLFFVFSFCPLS